MKKIGLVLVALLVGITFSGVCFADQYNTGCGLGSIMFKGQEGLLSQTCAATFNGTFGNQTFGITTGTSNCKKFETFANNENLNKFVAENMDNVANDIAKGDGEYLDTMAALMEIPQAERAGLYAKLQANFSKIYTSENVSHEDVLKNIDTVLSSS
jgi:hypothetical protein